MKGWEYDSFWVGENWVRHFEFDSLEDYLDYLRDTPVQQTFEQGGLGSEIGSFDFTETNSFEEALHLCRFGWHKDFNELVSRVEKIKRALDINLEPNRVFHDYVGFAPDVGAYLEGSPLSMVNKPPVHKPLITIYMNTSFNGSEPMERIYARGAAVIAVAEALELEGFAVDLRLFEMSFLDKEVHFSEFRVKAPDERINAAKLYFPLCNPSWVRRLNFRLIETSPQMTEGWAGSYGIPAETSLMREVLQLRENDILIPTIEELKIKGEDVLANAQRLFDCINVGLPEDKQLAYRK